MPTSSLTDKPMPVTAPAGPSDALDVQVTCDVGEPIRQEIARYLARSRLACGACGEHDPRWLVVLRDGLGHRPYMLIARKASTDGKTGAIRGYLPLALVASRLFGRYLVSLPYLNRAGVVAEDKQAETALLEAAVKLADKVNARYLELRHQEPRSGTGVLEKSGEQKVRMVMPLPSDGDYLWKTITAKVRNQVRKGHQNELAIAFGGSELVDDFYDVFAINMRDLGTPVYSRELFAQILWRFGDEAELAVVRSRNKPIAGALLIHDRLIEAAEPTTQVPSASCLRAYNKTNANMWMYYHLLERAIARGSTQFDFGRSTVDSNTFRFKKQWGAHPQPTTWQYHLRQGSVGELRPDHPRYRRRIDMWRRLPVWFTRLIGPPINRGIP